VKIHRRWWKKELHDLSGEGPRSIKASCHFPKREREEIGGKRVHSARLAGRERAFPLHLAGDNARKFLIPGNWGGRVLGTKANFASNGGIRIKRQGREEKKRRTVVLGKSF